MAMLPIRTFGDPVLRMKARPVEKITDVHRRLVDDMIETMRDAPGVGLAGTQVGVSSGSSCTRSRKTSVPSSIP